MREGKFNLTALLIKLFVENKKITDDSSKRSAYVTLGSATGICCNIFLFVIKLIAGLLSGSVSVIADAFNNFSDMGSSVVTFVGYKLSEKPADKEHPFGHGRIEYMSALLINVIIILVGVELLKSSVDKIINKSTLNLSLLTVIILAVSVLIKTWMFFFNRKLGRIINSKALLATAFDSLSDVAATSAVLAAIIIDLVFNINLDAYISLLVAAFIIFTGLKNAKETLDPLLGMPPDPEMTKQIEQTVLEYDDFTGIHDLIVHNYGPGRTFASLHVEVPDDINVLKCHEEIDECEKRLYEKLNAHVVIHMDPIATNDERVNNIKQQVTQKLKSYNSDFSIHDFRIVDGEQRINLIFDVVAKSSFKMSDSEISDAVKILCRELDSKYNAIVTVDRDYS